MAVRIGDEREREPEHQSRGRVRGGGDDSVEHRRPAVATVDQCRVRDHGGGQLPGCEADGEHNRPESARVTPLGNQPGRRDANKQAARASIRATRPHHDTGDRDGQGGGELERQPAAGGADERRVRLASGDQQRDHRDARYGEQGWREVAGAAGSYTRSSLEVGPDKGAAARAAVDREKPAGRCDALGEASQPRAARGFGTTRAVIDDVDPEKLASRRDTDRQLRGLRVLERVRDRLGAHEPGASLDLGRISSIRQRERHRQPRATGESAQGGSKAACVESYGIESLCEPHQLAAQSDQPLVEIARDRRSEGTDQPPRAAGRPGPARSSSSTRTAPTYAA